MIDNPIECPFYVISRVTLQVTSALKKGLAKSGARAVKPAYLGVLLCLWQEDGRKVVELGRCARLEPSTMTGLLDRMERDGLVNRSPDPDDRRAYKIWLTEKAKSLESSTQTVTESVLSDVFKGIPQKDLLNTMDVLKRVLSNIEEKTKK